jgi:hypothetical protein
MSDDEVELSLNCEASVLAEMRETRQHFFYFFTILFLFVSFRSSSRIVTVLLPGMRSPPEVNQVVGSARVSRAGFGVASKQAFIGFDSQAVRPNTEKNSRWRERHRPEPDWNLHAKRVRDPELTARAGATTIVFDYCRASVSDVCFGYPTVSGEDAA